MTNQLPSVSYALEEDLKFQHFKLLINHVHASSGTDIFVVGSLPKDAPDVGLGLVGAPACGDVMKLQIRVDKDTSKITDVKFKTFGCGSAIASSSYLTELVRGMTLDEAAKIRNTDIAKELCLPPVKLHCSMLAEDAIKSAINDYYTKNPKATKTDLSGTAASIPNVEKIDGSTASL
jgi:Fe-S cluster assembly scaffold IscU